MDKIFVILGSNPGTSEPHSGWGWVEGPKAFTTRAAAEAAMAKAIAANKDFSKKGFGYPTLEIVELEVASTASSETSSEKEEEGIPEYQECPNCGGDSVLSLTMECRGHCGFCG